MISRVTFATATILSMSASVAQADQVFADDLIVNNSGVGRICLGEGCADGEDWIDNFGALIELEDSRTMIHFNDTSIDGDDFPTRDWLLKANDDNDNGLDRFFLQDLGTSNIPFQVLADAPESAFVVSEDGGIGLGTSMPDFNLHMVGDSLSVMTYETTSNSQKWYVGSNVNNFFIQDQVTGEVVFKIARGAPGDSIRILDNGNIGLGTVSPDAPLELSSSDPFNFFRISATGAAVNESVDITFTGGPLGTGQLRYNIVDGDNQEMSLDADGNMVLDGTLTTAGPTCSGGCDRVFDADYPLPSIKDHAEQMFAKGYLPSIGATVPHAPVNVTEKLGHTINSLEHAHIYIAQQEAAIAQLMERVSALEAQ